MPRARPRAVRRYSDEFKLTAVRLSQQRGLQVKAVATALEIHPFMLGESFVTCLTQLGVLQSASVRGPGDNPHAESFFHSLKAELIRGTSFLTEHALPTELRRYMHYYNTRRMHSSLHYLSPLAFEQRTT